MTHEEIHFNCSLTVLSGTAFGGGVGAAAGGKRAAAIGAGAGALGSYI